jgi:hypothetical protein
LVVEGSTNGEIARALCLSESTVKSHLASAFVKLGVNSRSAAAALILDPDQGLTSAVVGPAPQRPLANRHLNGDALVARVALARS